MKFEARVEVKLKAGYIDPEGRATEQALSDLGYSVEGVRVSKMYEFTLDVMDGDEARHQSEQICRRVLANPTKDDYRITLEKVDGNARTR